MNDRTDPPAPLPTLTNTQLRQLIAAETEGVRPPCFDCGQLVADQTFTLGPGDEDQRMVVNAPCGHRFTYSVRVAEQIRSRLREEAATEATEPGEVNRIADDVAAELHRRIARLAGLRANPSVPQSTLRQVDGEVIGLRGALGIVLGGSVQGGSADELALTYYRVWLERTGEGS